MANEDFHGMSNSGLIIFANYWVCTVITTVGYGDYTGSTTLEYYFTICVAFFGFVIFSVLQIAVLQIVKVEKDFDSFIRDYDSKALGWFLRLEKSC